MQNEFDFLVYDLRNSMFNRTMQGASIERDFSASQFGFVNKYIGSVGADQYVTITDSLGNLFDVSGVSRLEDGSIQGP